MFKPTKLATIVAMACTYHSVALANEKTNQLEEIQVVENTTNTFVNSSVESKEINLKQPRNVKDLLKDQLDVVVADLQGSRAGNESVNIRGLAGNRISTTIDGISLPETQENPLMMAFGIEFGRGDYIEPTSLNRAEIIYGGSGQRLSSAVNFSTLEPEHLLKNRSLGGFVATGYNSVDTSNYQTLGGAVQNGNYQGMAMATLRNGHETKTQGKNAGLGDNRTEADPKDYRNVYFLTKHNFKLNESHSLGFTYEHQYKKTKTDLLSKNTTAITGLGSPFQPGIQTSGYTNDTIRRDRFSVKHQYKNENSWLQYAETLVYFQDAKTYMDKTRYAGTRYRIDEGNVRDTTWGFKTDFMSPINGSIPQMLHYGFSFSQLDFTNDINQVRSTSPSNAYGCSASVPNNNYCLSADTKLDKWNAYISDEIAFGNFIVIPHLEILHYRTKPSLDGYFQWGTEKVEKQKATLFTPKISLQWQVADLFNPYFQYSRGVKTPSVQQLSSSFGNSRTIPGMGTAEYSVVGNSNLTAEKADNFELGFKGNNGKLQYRVTSFYSQYKDFIDWKCLRRGNLGPISYCAVTQFVNYDKAKVYGITANAKWNFIGDFYSSAGINYSRGKEETNNVKLPINSIQPLKVKLGLAYEGDVFGANVDWTYNRQKSDKDINGNMYNPTAGYALVDLGVYWKPVKGFTLTAGVNNLFNKKYWDWNNIAYFANLSDQFATMGQQGVQPFKFDDANSERYTSPGRNFNIGVRYEF